MSQAKAKLRLGRAFNYWGIRKSQNFWSRESAWPPGLMNNSTPKKLKLTHAWAPVTAE
jgi:hypothetical protein